MNKPRNREQPVKEISQQELYLFASELLLAYSDQRKESFLKYLKETKGMTMQEKEEEWEERHSQLIVTVAAMSVRTFYEQTRKDMNKGKGPAAMHLFKTPDEYDEEDQESIIPLPTDDESA